MQCKFIKKDGKRCMARQMIFDDGCCIQHSKTEKGKEARKKSHMKEKFDREKSSIAKEFKFPSQKPLKQIRRNCLACCETRRDVLFCASVNCNLWYFRFGERPQAFVRNNGKEYARLFNPENFKKGRRYDPDTCIEDMRL